MHTNDVLLQLNQTNLSLLLFQTFSARQGPYPGQVFSYINRTKNPIPVLAIPGSFTEFSGSLHPLVSNLIIPIIVSNLSFARSVSYVRISRIVSNLSIPRSPSWCRSKNVKISLHGHLCCPIQGKIKNTLLSASAIASSLDKFSVSRSRKMCVQEMRTGGKTWDPGNYFNGRSECKSLKTYQHSTI